MSDRGNDACWASCNVLLVLGILADGERAGHEIITILERQCDRTFARHEGDLLRRLFGVLLLYIGAKELFTKRKNPGTDPKPSSSNRVTRENHGGSPPRNP